MFQRELPLLVVVEGENDICFLKGMSRILRRSDPSLPNLCELEAMRRIVFMPSCGNTSTPGLHGWLPSACVSSTCSTVSRNRKPLNDRGSRI